MIERDPLIALAAGLPTLATAVKKLDHPVLELLVDQAQAELANLTQAATPANYNDGQADSSQAIRSTVSD